MPRRHGLGKFLVVLLIGALAGSVVGELIRFFFGHFFPNSMVEKFFLQALVEYTLPPATLPLVVLSITFGFSLKINIISVIGIAVAAYYFRWY